MQHIESLIISYLHFIKENYKVNVPEECFNYIDEFIFKDKEDKKLYINEALKMYDNGDIPKVCFYCKKSSTFMCSKTLNLKKKDEIYYCKEHFDRDDNYFEKLKNKDFFTCDVFFENKKFNKEKYFLLN